MKRHNGNKSPKQPEMFVVDGTNVCFWFKHHFTGRDLVSVRPLLLLLSEMREHGDDFYCIFDHTIKDHLPSLREADLVEWLVRRYPDRFFRTALESKADPLILHYASKHGCRIISNDRYRDHFETFPWLATKNTPRLIQGNLHKGGLLTLEKLPYGMMELSPSIYTQDLVNRLVNTFKPDYDWKASSKDRAASQPDTSKDVKESEISSGSTAQENQEKQSGKQQTSSKTKPLQKRTRKTPSKKTVKKVGKKALKAYKAKSKSGTSKRKSSTPRRKRKSGILDWLFGKSS